MKHFGDITKLSGYKLPLVDVITGGSPCQDLSVAGKRAGLAGERSGLFMEQIRIVKEMRERDKADGRTDELIRPRYMVWENVPGAFSSNKGEDFRAVLEETAKISDKNTIIPKSENGKWTPSGCIMGNGWSIAWRVHDAQFWGVPQRRKRIALVADFGGLTAPEILFERESVSRDIAESGKEGQETAGNAGIGTTETSGFNGWQSVTASMPIINNGTPPMYKDDVAGTGDNQQAVVYGISAFDSNAMKSDNPHAGIYKAETSRTLDLNGGSPACNQGGMAVVMVGSFYPQRKAESQCWHEDDVMNTLVNGTSPGYHNGVVTAVDCRSGTENESINGTLQAKSNGGISVNLQNVVRLGAVVRRLTPLECERLQGYPDGWTDIGEWVDSKSKKHKDADSPRYKALGNSIALPFWQWMARRICAQYERTVTMASLFDGIGGFPLVFERCGAKAVWASEIEEFPIAVTKRNFP